MHSLVRSEIGRLREGFGADGTLEGPLIGVRPQVSLECRGTGVVAAANIAVVCALIGGRTGAVIALALRALERCLESSLLANLQLVVRVRRATGSGPVLLCKPLLLALVRGRCEHRGVIHRSVHHLKDCGIGPG